MNLRRFSRFAVTGCLNSLIHGGIVAFFYQWVLKDAVMANGVAFAVASTVSYQINARWTFSAARTPERCARFLSVALMGLLLTVMIAGLLEALGWGVFAGTLGVMVLLPPITFLLHQHWTFRAHQANPSVGEFGR